MAGSCEHGNEPLVSMEFTCSSTYITHKHLGRTQVLHVEVNLDH